MRTAHEVGGVPGLLRRRLDSLVLDRLVLRRMLHARRDAHDQDLGAAAHGLRVPRRRSTARLRVSAAWCEARRAGMSASPSDSETSSLGNIDARRVNHSASLHVGPSLVRMGPSYTSR